MILKIFELISIFLSALVTGVFFGPWLGLIRSGPPFPPEVFLTIGHRMIRNLAPVMSRLMPAALLSTLAVLYLSFRTNTNAFYFALAGFALFVIALLVTLIVEVPIDDKIRTWTVANLPKEWEQLRDRWNAFHLVRVVASLMGLACLLIGAIF